MAQTTRFAGPTIKGYVYQFDRTILELLKATPGIDVVVEHLEDIGVDAPAIETAIQCKYLEASTLSKSTLRDPIEKMLLGFRDRDPKAKPIQFVLGIHCSAVGKEYSDPKNVDDLKSILTYTHKSVEHRFYKDESLSDALLQDFLSNFEIQLGPSYEAQQSNVLKGLASSCACTVDEADLLHYPIALRTVIQMAVDPDESNRRMNHHSFLQAVSVKETLFNAWYLEIRGTENVVKLVKKQLKDRKLLHPNREKLVYLGPTYLSKPKDTAKAIRQVTEDHYCLNKSLDDAIPPTFVIAGKPTDLNELKLELITTGFDYNDGYEPINFLASSFLRRPIINRKNRKIVSSSFLARLASAECFKQCTTFAPDVIIAFGSDGSELFQGFSDVYHLPTIPTNALIEIIKRA